MITEDQIARVRRMSQDLRHSPIPDEREDAAALTALLAAVERMPMREQLDALQYTGDAGLDGPVCAACGRENELDVSRGVLIAHHTADCWLARALLTAPEEAR